MDRGTLMLGLLVALKASVEGPTDLPTGEPISKELKKWFRRQEKQVKGMLLADVPADFPSLADYNDPMAAAMTPIIAAYWDESGKKTNSRLGLDPKAWEVSDPHLTEKIGKASFDFCEATNATTHMALSDALLNLRAEFTAGLVDRGETLKQLTKRVQSVFVDAKEYRAERIAATESSRAVHAASMESAIQSGVVSSKRLLISSDACNLCQSVAATEPEGGWRLESPMAVIGDHPSYSNIPHPPIHPNCNCTIVYELVDEFKPTVEPAEVGYREFVAAGEEPDDESMREMFNWGIANWHDWLQSLSDDERRALSAYKGPLFSPINDALRTENIDSHLSRDIRHIDAAVARGHVPENVIVWRGIKDLKSLTGVDITNADSLVGAIIHDKAYISTSINPDVAEGQSRISKGALLRMRLPKGTPAVYLDNLTGKIQPNDPSVPISTIHNAEMEILLARNQSFKVVGVSRVNGRIVLDLEKTVPVVVPKPIPVAVPIPAPVPAPAPIPIPAPVVAPKPPPEPVRKPGEPILPGRPIAERLAAWTEGDKLVAEIAGLGDAAEKQRAELWTERQALNRKFFNINVDFKKQSDRAAAARKLQAEMDAIDAKRGELKFGIPGQVADRLKISADRRLGVSVGSPAPSSRLPSSNVLPDAQIMDKANKAQKWLDSIVGQSRPYEKPVSVEVVQWRKGTYDSRAEYSDFHARMILTPFHPEHVVVHEMGHGLEYQIPEVQKRANEFREYRVGNEAPTNLRAKFGERFNADEQGYEDEFGKFFGAGQPSAFYAGKPYMSGSTELISMGVEALYNNPSEFAKKDPEYVKWIIGIMHGDLR